MLLPDGAATARNAANAAPLKPEDPWRHPAWMMAVSRRALHEYIVHSPDYRQQILELVPSCNG